MLMEAPYYINWNITNSCPMDCRHCYSRTSGAGEVLDAAGRMVIAERLAASKVFSVNLGGGEPLLLDDILLIVGILSKNDINVSLSTSGWKGLKDQAQELKDSGLASVIVSIDNASPIAHDRFRRCPGSHAATLAAASRYTSVGLPVSISTVLTSENIGSLEALLELALRIGASGLEFKRLRLVGNAANLSELLLSPKQEQLVFEKLPEWKSQYPFRIGLTYAENPVAGIDQGCPCGRSSLCVLANGDVAPCVYNPKVIGNLLYDDIDELWTGSPLLLGLRMGFHCQGQEE